MKSKILPRNELRDALQALRAQGKTKKIVFTNGCFDILHVGHVRYLHEARRLGDLLVVGMNSDSSVRGIKGQGRPINPEASRAEVLAALADVDFVTIFDEPDPLSLVTLLEPDVMVKGGDWDLENLIGADVVRARGGSVRVIPYVEGDSTTDLIEKIVGKALREERGGKSGKI